MREQQIVITLKPEQFAQVQKLSKAAGAKSMGIFVRKALLAALGIEAAGKGQHAHGTQADPAQLRALAEDLKRMHIELRELVAEDAAAGEQRSGGSSSGDAAAGEQRSGGASVGAQHAVPAGASQPRSGASKDTRDLAVDQPEDSQSDIEEGNYSFADTGAGFSDDPLADLLDHSLMSRLQDYLVHSRAEKEAEELGHVDNIEPAEEIDEADEEEEPAETQAQGKEQEISKFQPQNSLEPKKNQNSSDISGGPPPKKGI